MNIREIDLSIIECCFKIKDELYKTHSCTPTMTNRANIEDMFLVMIEQYKLQSSRRYKLISRLLISRLLIAKKLKDVSWKYRLINWLLR